MDAPGAAQAAGAVGARVKRALPQSRSWAWGQRQLTRIAELRSQAEVMRVRADGENQAERLANDALAPDGSAGHRGRGNGRRAHAWEDAVTTNINAATCLIYRYAPLAEVQAMLPDVVATIDEQLPDRPRRTAADDILRRFQKANGKAALTEAERGVIVAAVRTAPGAGARVPPHPQLPPTHPRGERLSAVIAVAVAVTAALGTRRSRRSASPPRPRSSARPRRRARRRRRRRGRPWSHRAGTTPCSSWSAWSRPPSPPRPRCARSREPRHRSTSRSPLPSSSSRPAP